jgi:hypothetical protein
MLQQTHSVDIAVPSGVGLSPEGAAAAPRGARTGFELPEAVVRRVREFAARHDVSVNEVLIQCLNYGLYDRDVLRLISGERRRKNLDHGPRLRCEFLLPQDLKDRLAIVATALRVDRLQVAFRCLDYGIDSTTIENATRIVVASRLRKPGRTVRLDRVTSAA